jgi:hypothetical protein
MGLGGDERTKVDLPIFVDPLFEALALETQGFGGIDSGERAIGAGSSCSSERGESLSIRSDAGE